MPTDLAAHARRQFPALDRGTIFLDNAGGSQIPIQAIDAVQRYFIESFSQMGGEYDQSVRAARTVKTAHSVVKAYLNGGTPGWGRPAGFEAGQGSGDVILGTSTTALIHLIANAYADAHSQRPGRNQIIVCTAAHEANVWPWARLSGRGFEIVPWHLEAEGLGLRSGMRPNIGTLRTLLNDRTLLVAFPQVSNILGETWDARAVADAAHAVGARVMIDGVAYAPHHAPDVVALACDWFVYSTYKVYGPHMAALFGTHNAWAGLTGPNHPFIPREETHRKWELGGVSHEGCAAIAALKDFAAVLCGEDTNAPIERGVFERAFKIIEELERPLTERLLAHLRTRSKVKIIGSAEAGPDRICTVAFTVEGRKSADIAKAANAKGLGIRFGHFYSRRLVERLRLDPDDGVVRVSLAHYNTPAELDQLSAHFDDTL